MVWVWGRISNTLGKHEDRLGIRTSNVALLRCTARISGLVVEYIVAIDVTWVRFPADAYYWTWGRAIHWHVLAYCCGTEGVNQICETRAIHENPLVVGFRVIDIGVFCKKRVEAPAWRIKLDSNPTGPILRISESPIIYKG